MNTNPFLSVVIPVFNESKRLHHLSSVIDYFATQKFSSEIIVVNDGSTDDTLGLLNQYKSKMLKILTYPQNHGKGYAIKQGMLSSKGNYSLFMDIDLSTPLDQFPKFLPLLSQFDILIGSRKTKGANLTAHQPFVREMLGKCFTLLSQIILQTKITDFTCGFKCFSSAAVQKIFPYSLVDRWGFDSEILYLARLQKLTIKEIPVSWQNDTASRVKFPHDIIRSLRDLYQIRTNHYSFSGFLPVRKSRKTRLPIE